MPHTIAIRRNRDRSYAVLIDGFQYTTLARLTRDEAEAAANTRRTAFQRARADVRIVREG